MLRLLLCLSALGLLVGAAPTTVTNGDAIDLTSCPIIYYGDPYTLARVVVINGGFGLCFFAPFDCILFPPSTTLDYEILTSTDVAATAAIIDTAFTHISAADVQCGIKFTFTSNGASEVYVLSFGTQAAAYINADLRTTDVFSFNYIDGQYETTAPQAAGPFTESVDLTRCRDIDIFTTYAVGATASTDSSTCTVTNCLTTGLFGTTENCGTGQVCLGNDVCGDEHFCSIVGQSVLDFDSATGVIPDFCAYDIIQRTVITVTAKFRERRLIDTPFLDSISIFTTSSGIHLYQGGEVLVDGVTDLTLSTTPVTHFGVSLTKDENGVTASFTDSSGITSLFYDGTLLHVTQTVPVGQSKQTSGMCATATGASTNKNAASSYTGCDTVTADNFTVSSCDDIKARCTAELDSVTGSELDKTPYVTFCADNLLCSYPEVDDLYCHFVHAYALTAKISNWKEQSSCPLSVCASHVCAGYEFCAVAPSGKAACFCRPLDPDIIAYKEVSAYGPAATCTAGAASVILAGCFLEEKGVNVQGLHLNNADCVGTVPQPGEVVFEFDTTNTCGGTYETVGTEVKFSNTIQNTHSSTITFEESVAFDFSCTYNLPDAPSTASFKIAAGTFTLTYDAVDFSFTMSIGLFTDSAFTTAVSATTALALDQKVWVRLQGNELGGDGLALVIDNCWTTSVADPTDASKYDLISSKCAVPSDGTVVVESSGQASEAVFTFNVFEYVDISATDMYLHCQVSPCIIADGNCVPGCT